MKVGAVDATRAQWQHATFTRLLTDLGARVTKLPFVHDAFDSVFAKDNAILVDDRALLAHPLHHQRLAEQGPRAKALLENGFVVHTMPREPLEGGDVVVLPNVSGALMGCGFRSSRRSSRDLEDFLDAPVTPIELVEERLYHLDMAVTVLADGTAIACEDAIAPDSLELLRGRVKRVIPISIEDALTFGVNMVEVGAHVVLGGRSQTIARALQDIGRTTHAPLLDQFHLAGGSAACLVSRRHVSRAGMSRAA